jgi:hypothetical protein
MQGDLFRLDTFLHGNVRLGQDLHALIKFSYAVADVVAVCLGRGFVTFSFQEG